jgi:trimethylamine--corrinoid protein Co-methyltransferase
MADSRATAEGLPEARVRPFGEPSRVLGEHGVAVVHEAAMRILVEVGCEVHDDEALALLRDHGQAVDGSRVRPDPDWVLGLVAQAPSHFELHGRGEARVVAVGGDARAVLTPSGGSPFASDRERGRREGTLADHDELVRLAHASGELTAMQSGVCEAQDLPETSRHLDMDYSCLRWSDWPYVTYGTSAEKARDGIELAAMVAGGSDELAARPRVVGVVNPNSPLVWDGLMVGALREWARAGQPVAVTPFLLGGASAPVSIAGALAQQTAEALFGVALAQLERPGAPCIFGSFSTPVDMRSGGPAFGTPEAVLATIAGGELARRYDVPYRGGGALCSGNTLDGQVASEALMSLWATSLAGSHLVMHAAGWIEGGLTTSYEKLVMDAELLRSFRRMREGVDLAEPEFALEMLLAEGPGGMFLASDHTMERFRDLWMSPLYRAQAYPTWEKKGSPTQAELATAEWRRLLEAYEDPGIDPALDTELRAFVAARGRQFDA